MLIMNYCVDVLRLWFAQNKRFGCDQGSLRDMQLRHLRQLVGLNQFIVIRSIRDDIRETEAVFRTYDYTCNVFENRELKQFETLA